MSLKIRVILGVVLALTLGSVAGEPYTAAAAPYYTYVTRLLADGHPWTIVTVELAPDDRSPAKVLRLIGQVQRHTGDPYPGARVVQRVQLGEVIETVAVFWPLVLLWPVTATRQRLLVCLIGIPVFLLLEAGTTGIQLIHTLPQATAMLNGDPDPLTPWERYSRFLEGGGRFVLEVLGALLTIGAAKGRWHKPAGTGIPAAPPQEPV